jgi:4-hydroxy-3-methylbut-2-enyl diphosphate reductase
MNEGSERAILVASPRGFCAGVSYAIEIVDLVLDRHGPPVYVRHEIVHNRHVVDQLRARGARFVEDLAQVPHGSLLVFSAHGVSPAVREEARRRGLLVVDATCPLVTKVHLEAQRYAREGYEILLIGHRGHVEVIGTLGHAPERMHLVETVEDVERLDLPDPDRVAVVTQTTLSVDDTRAIFDAIRRRFPKVRTPAKDDICYATQNRQTAVKELARQSDFVLVIGSPTSSNANRLVEVAACEGARAQLIEDALDIRPEWLAGVRNVGLTAGASTPETLVGETVSRLQALGFGAVRDLSTADEHVNFPLPRELRGQAVRTGGA